MDRKIRFNFHFISFISLKKNNNMSNALDMSLDDIIKVEKKRTPSRGGRGNRASGPTRNTFRTRDRRPYQAGAQPYRAVPTATLHTAVIRESVPDGSKMQVSNLDHRVTAEDLKVIQQRSRLFSPYFPGFV
jgi:hypothetical protein